jgi:hypothetical protein
LRRQHLLFEGAGREPPLLGDVAIRPFPGARDGLLPQGLGNPFGGVRALLPPVSKLGGDMVEWGDNGIRDLYGHTGLHGIGLLLRRTVSHEKTIFTRACRKQTSILMV